MELKKALTLRLSFNDLDGSIRVDENDYICLNDLAAYYPHKKLHKWKENQSTKDFIDILDQDLNNPNSGYLKSSLLSKRGKYGGGTYAQYDLAMKFAMWLSPELELLVIRAFRMGTQRKLDWNIQRILAANNYKMMSQSIANDHDPAKHYHYSNEAKMLNGIVFGNRDSNQRDTATELQLDSIAWLESTNATLIDIDMDYQDRKIKLNELFVKKYLTTSLLSE